MNEIRHAELASVGPDRIVVTFMTDPEVRVTTVIGGTEVVTEGPHHVAIVDGLEPGGEHGVTVEGLAATEHLPASVQTPHRPPGRLLTTIATVNDVHLGETDCGISGIAELDALGPLLSVGPDEEPYPLTMNRAAVAEMRCVRPDIYLVKGDLTDKGTPEEYETFLEVYSPLGARMYHVRGNHDAMIDPNLAPSGAFDIEDDGVVVAVLDTTIPGTDKGTLPAEQIEWLDELAAATSSPVLVFGHHQPWNPASPVREQDYFGIHPDPSDALIEVFARRENIVGYFAGHTHRNRVRRFPQARSIPIVEVGCTKDYPGSWAEYRVYEGGFTQVVHRIVDPAAMAWSEKARGMFQGFYRDYALGSQADRTFTEVF